MNRHDNFDFTLVCTVKFYRRKRSLPPDLSNGKYCPHFIADVNAKDDMGRTPLAEALATCRNSNIAQGCFQIRLLFL